MRNEHCKIAELCGHVRERPVLDNTLIGPGLGHVGDEGQIFYLVTATHRTRLQVLGVQEHCTGGVGSAGRCAGEFRPANGGPHCGPIAAHRHHVSILFEHEETCFVDSSARKRVAASSQQKY
ncbi:hypothetical protein BgiMline_032655 [Biomphalaria glabrata]|nr:hypothetical protein BgiMline_015668 [Biomphalaria glabrata]